MKLPKMTLSLLALVAANVVPLVGVVLLGWDAAVIVLLYWTENLVIGFYNILKMAMVKAPHSTVQNSKLFVIPFFCLHFGAFCAGHGFFLIVMFKVGGGMESFSRGFNWPGPLVFMEMLVRVIIHLWHHHPPGMEWPVIGLFVSHGISFVQNYLGEKEYASLSLQQLMAQPYKRIVILHIALIAGAAPVMFLGSPVGLLFILVFLKIGMDIFLHVKEHKSTADVEVQDSR